MPDTNATTGTRGHSCGSTAFAALHASDLRRSLVARFAQQVAVHSECLAVRDPTTSLTYAELDAWANGIAHAALAAGAESEPIALLLTQGATNIAAILGTLKAGSAYASLDVRDPRAAELVDRVGARVVLSDTKHLDVARRAASARPVITVDRVESGDTPSVDVSPEDIAYAFFTSGSTGRPKCVIDSHRNVLHNVLRYTNTLRIAPTDRLSLLQSPTFSGTVSTVFSALLSGASVFPFSLEEHGLGALARWLLDEKVTIYHSVPAIFRSLLAVEPGPFESVRVVRLEGDRAASLDVDLHRSHFAADSILVNGLGLTETGLVRQLFIDRTSRVEPGALPVGYAVPDVGVVVLGEKGEVLAPGAPGEIAVASEYLALGYLYDDDLTAERFRTVAGRRTYLTGDLGRLRRDGCLEYLGRRDGVLKVLGTRVEPAEVESALLQIPGLRDAAVTTRAGRRGEGQLIATVVVDPEEAPSAAEIRQALGERLPAFMVPSIVELVDELPLSPGGKVDRAALREPVLDVASTLPAAGREQLVARIWEETLEKTPIGLDDDFFALGGDSLAAAEIVARLEVETGVEIPIGLLVSAPTVAGLAAALEASTNRSLAILNADGDGPPLIFCHGFYPGHKFLLADVARRITGRPTWEIDPPTADVGSLEEAVSRTLDVIRRAQPQGPYHLAGFCSGGILAREAAMRLVSEGNEVALLAILGISPVDFPLLLAPPAYVRWNRHDRNFLSLVRRDLSRARSTPLRDLPTFLADRIRAAGRRGRGLASPRHAWSATHEPFQGRALLVLGEETTSTYTDDPTHDWSALAREPLDVVVLPGNDHAMLARPVVDDLAAILTDRLELASPGLRRR